MFGFHQKGGVDRIIQICKIFFLIISIFFSLDLANGKESSKNIYGNYLSWNFAKNIGDIGKGRDFFTNVNFSELSDNSIEEIFFESVILGDWSNASLISNQILKKNKENFAANLFNVTESFLNKDAQQSIKYLNRINTQEFDLNFIKTLMMWVSYPKKTNLIHEIDDNDCIPLLCLHGGIFYMLENEMQTAEKYFKKLNQDEFGSLRVKELLLYSFLKLDNEEIAAKILRDVSESNLNFQKRNIDFFLNNHNYLNPVLNSNDGLAETFYNISSWFYSKDLFMYSAFFGNLSLRVRSDFYAMKLLLLGTYNQLGYVSLANKLLNQVSSKNLYFFKFAQIKISLLEKIDKNHELLNYLKDLNKEFPNNIDIKILLADKLRKNNNFLESIVFYSEIIKNESVANKWSLHYSRGIAYERLNQWEKAENDLLEAIELRPDQPYVLNYLAYSWLDRNLNVNKALVMLEKAIKLEPGDAYIIDSLGWAYYLSGLLDKSIYYLEKAVTILPNDATLNDHLGDVYWKVGRNQEAISQWKKVLIFDPAFKKKKI